MAVGGSQLLLWATPYRVYSGHKQDVVDLAWSPSNFLLSASIDKTVRLWHVSRPKCLCVFQHPDFVTAVSFHPKEDRYFVSGSFDKKCRVWNIPEHRVIDWVQTATIITAVAFSPLGDRVVAGLYSGQCVFYQSDGLKYFTQIECRNRHGRNAKGKKVTGLEYSSDGKLLLVTTNDSRVRLFDMTDFSTVTKFKGLTNDALQIRSHFNEDSSWVISGSETGQVWVWGAKERGKVEAVEYFKATHSTATCAIFLNKKALALSVALNTHTASTDSTASPPVPHTTHQHHSTHQVSLTPTISTTSSSPSLPASSSSSTTAATTTTPATSSSSASISSSMASAKPSIRHVIVVAGYDGEIRLFENVGAPKPV